ncbi:MAG: VIT domain-containing protein [Planctomycetota bacterium]|nr:VIT domain-containing protein [Planctomycetota bacterium]
MISRTFASRLLAGPVFALAALCLLAPAPAHAQADRRVHIIIPPAPPPVRTDLAVRLTAVDVTVQITDQVATTTLDLSLTNTGPRPAETQIVLPVPDGVAIRSLQWDGTGAEPKGEVLPRDEARRIYEEIVRGQRDPALVEFAGFNLIRTSVFPVPPNSTQHLRLTYEHVLPADAGRLDYSMIRSEAFAPTDVRWSITADITSKQPIATVYSPSHDITQERLAPGRVKVRSTPRATDRGAFMLSVLSERAPGELATTLYLYPEADQTLGGYFMLVLAPPAAPRDTEPRKREVVLVLDRSGSMRGEKFEQVRQAATQVVRGLREGEFFNIIDYSDTIASFAPAPVEKTAASAKDAEKYIWGLTANGGTNIHDSLLEALRPAPAPGTVPLVLFLTDGLPTVGERGEAKIREAMKAANASKRRIFTFGVGLDVNAPLLSALATNARGATSIVLPEEDVEVKVSQVFRRLQGPVLTEPAMASLAPDGGLSARLVRDQLPATLPDVFEGDQIVLLGRYTSDRAFTLRVSGVAGDVPRAFDVTIDPAHATTRHAFVPRLWAVRKVATLVDEIRQAGADGGAPSEGRMKELTEEIVRLSTTWGILTEYTAFLAREDTTFIGGLPARAPAAMENLQRRAISERSGGGGAAQQMDQTEKLGATNANARGLETYVGQTRDGAIESIKVDSVQYFAGRAFYQRAGNRWVESALLEKESEAPDVVIEFGSPEYFRLAERLAKDNRQSLLAQRAEVYLEVDSKRVLVQAP